MKTFVKILLTVCTLSVSVNTFSGSIRLASGELSSLASGVSLYSSSGGATLGDFGRTQISPEILALVDGLVLLATDPSDGELDIEKYAKSAYAYVKSEVKTEFRFGLSKGALGALTDKSGTPFDQVHLLKALLDQKGIASTYELGTASLNSAEFGLWTGISTAKEACILLASGGIPGDINGQSPQDCNLSGNLSSIDFSHVWLSVNIEGSSYAWDPSYKQIVYKSPKDLESMTGYNRDAFVNAVGSDVSSLSVENALTTLAETFYQNVSSDKYERAEEVLGGAFIARKQLPENVGAQLHYSASSIRSVAAIPDSLRTKVTFEYVESSSNPTVIASYDFFSDLVYGSPITFSKDSHPQVASENSLCRFKFNHSQVIDSRVFNSQTVRIKVDHPYLSTEQGSNNEYMDQESIFTLKCDLPSQLILGLGDFGAQHQELLNRQRKDERVNFVTGYNPTRFLDSTLGWTKIASAAGSFLFEQSERADLISSVSQSHIENHHSIGLVSQPIHIFLNGTQRSVGQQSLDISVDSSFSHAGRKPYEHTPASDLSLPPYDVVNKDSCNWSDIFSQGGVIDIDGFMCSGQQAVVRTNDLQQNTCQISASNGYRVIGNCIAFSVWKENPSSIAAVAEFPSIPSRQGLGKTLSWFLASLEGEITQNITGGYSNFSTPHRFSWGIDHEDVGFSTYGTGATIAPPSLSIFQSSDPEVTLSISNDASLIADAISATAVQLQSEGYQVTIPSVAIMGPGELSWTNNIGPSCTFCNPSTVYLAQLGYQNGGVLYAEHPETGDFKHFMFSQNGTIRGGGSGVQSLSLGGSTIEPPKPEDRQKFELGVNKVSGEASYSFDSIISIGGDFPYGLSAGVSVSTELNEPEFSVVTDQADEFQPWERVQRRFRISGLGSLSFNSNGANLLGARSALEASEFVATMVVLNDLADSGNYLSTVTSAQALKWFSDQVVNSGIQVNGSQGSETFVRHVDGVFRPKPGSPSSLEVTSNGFVLDTFQGGGCSSSAPSGAGRPDWMKAGRTRTVSGTFVHTLKNGDKETYSATTYDGARENCTPTERWHPLVTYSNNKGVTVSYEYDSLKQIDKISNSLGRVLDFVHSGDAASGYKLDICDIAGCSGPRRATVEEQGTLVKVKDSGGSTWNAELSFESTSNHSPLLGHVLTAVYAPEDSDDPAIRYSHGNSWKIEAVDLRHKYHGENQYWEKAYSWGLLPGYAVVEQDYVGAQSVDYLDAWGNSVLGTDALNVKTLRGYDAWGREVVSRVFPKSQAIDEFSNDVAACSHNDGLTAFVSKKCNTYDDNSNILKEIQYPVLAAPNAEEPIVVDRTWHSTYNSLLTESFPYFEGDVSRNAITNEYDPASGVIEKTTDAAGLVVEYLNHWNGLPKLVKEGAVRHTVLDYDAFGNLQTHTVQKPNGAEPIVTSATYEHPQYGNIGDIVTLTDPNNKTYIADYYPNRKIRSIEDPLENIQRFNYTGSGKFWLMESLGSNGGYRLNQATYNPLGWMTASWDHEGDTTEYQYDARGLLTYVTDPMDRVKRYDYDLRGKLACVRDGWGTAKQRTYKHLQYSELGNVTEYNSADSDPNSDCVLDNTNKQTSVEYDAYGRAYKTIFPYVSGHGTTSEELTYYPSGNIKTKLNRRGETISYLYDDANRVDLKTVAAGSANAYSVDYQAYDVFSQPQIIVQSGVKNSRLDYSYDFAGRGVETAALTIGNGPKRSLTIDYDGSGNKTKLIWPDNYTVDFVPDALNRLDLVKVGSLVVADYDYNDLSELKYLELGNNSNSTFGYEPDGDLDSIAHDFVGSNDVTFNYDYNDAAQLVSNSFTNANFRLKMPSTKSDSYVPNNLNQYTNVGGSSFVYDAAGNLAFGPKGSFTYDAENKLLKAVVGSAGPQGSLIANYSYDANGHRIEKNITQSGSETVIQYLLDGDHEVAEYGTTGLVPTKRFIYGYNTDQLVAIHNVGVNSYDYIHANHQGSIVAISDSTGAVAQSDIYTYTPYGEARTATGGLPQPSAPYLYTGRRYDSETGLYYYRARYYDPALGRFMQTDPIGYEDQMNLYAYVHSDPLNNFDPSGESCAVAQGEVSCKVDENQGGWKNKELARVNEIYTDSVNRLLEHPDREVEVDVDGDSFKVTAEEQADILINAKVIATESNGKNRATTEGGPLHPDSESGGVEIRLRETILNDVGDRRIANTLVHESIHGNKKEKVLKAKSRDPNFRSDHRYPYSKAARELLKK